MNPIPDRPTGFKRQPVSKKLRFDILTRDNFTCVYCGATAKEAILQVDHRRAVANGGDNDPANLCTACQPCNLGKGARDIHGVSGIQSASSLIERPRLEFFWSHAHGRMSKARCVEFERDPHIYGGWQYRTLCNDLSLSTHGHSGSGFSPYEAEMYAVDLLAQDWQTLEAYVEYIDDLNIVAAAGLIPMGIAPHVLRALHPETVYRRCLSRPDDYEAIADRIADQSSVVFRSVLAASHFPWREAR